MVKVNPSISLNLPQYDRALDRTIKNKLDAPEQSKDDVVKISEEAIKKHIVGRLKARLSGQEEA